MDIKTRLRKLQDSLLSCDAKYDLFGAALFDHEALLQAIDKAQQPQNDGLYDRRQHFFTEISKLLKTLYTCLENGGDETLVGPTIPDQCRISPVDYGHIVAVIRDCEFEEEARLRVALVKTVVTKIRNILNSNGERRDAKQSRDAIMERCLLHKKERLAVVEHYEKVVLWWRELAYERNPDGVPGDDPNVRKAEELLDQARKQLRDTAPIGLYNRVSLGRHNAHCVENVMGRTFFITRRGLAGCGPPKATDIRKGDKLIMLQTSHEPFIIRPTDDPKYHTVVGFGIVRGLSDRLFHDLPDEKKPAMKIFKFK